jgi:Rod binding domain-containing protein
VIMDAITTQIRPAHWRKLLASKSENRSDFGVSDLAKMRLEGAVKDLEALLFYEMLKEMRQTTQGGILGKGLGNDIYTSLFDMEMAKRFADRGLGFGDLILQQITGQSTKSSANNPSSPEELSNSFLKKDPDPILEGVRQSETPVIRDPLLENSLPAPVEGQVSSSFGWRSDPFTKEKKFHNGIDIAVPSGEEIYLKRRESDF